MNGKTIDDIIRESDIISALSAAPADVTNVETMNTFVGPDPYAQSQYSMREMEPHMVGTGGLGFLEYATTPAAASASFLKSLLGKGAKFSKAAKEPMKLLTSGKRSSAGELLEQLSKTRVGKRISKSDPRNFLSEVDRDIIAKAYSKGFNLETYAKAQAALKKASDLASKHDKGLAKAFQDLNELLKLSMPSSIALPGKVLK